MRRLFYFKFFCKENRCINFNNAFAEYFTNSTSVRRNNA